jgi:citrate synthase
MNHPVAIPTNAKEIPAGRTGAASGPRGEPVGTTGFCTVGNEGSGRTNRGDSLEELDEGSNFEEVASLLLRGAPPTRGAGCLQGSPEGTPTRIASEAQGGAGADPRRGQSEGRHGCAPDRLLEPRDAGAGERFRASDRHPNVDFSTASADRLLGPPTSLFALARVAGRAAEVAEQRARNKLIDPTADDSGPETRSFAPLADREAGAGPRG